jgi:hypothetical protein
MDFITNIITSSAVSGILIWISREWISSRIKASIQHEYDQKLEAHKARLKAENDIALLQLRTALEREAALHAVAHTSFSEGQKAAMERRLNAFEKFWNIVLKLRNSLPSLLVYIDISSVDEYEKLVDHQGFRSLVQDLTHEKITIMADSIFGKIEEVRPYVGEYMWAILWSYRAIMFRLLILLHDGLTDREKMNWNKDSGIRPLISVVLTPEELREFDGRKFAQVSWLQQCLESKILSAARKVISGEEFGAESLDQARQIQEQVAQLQRKTELPTT